MLEHLEEPLTIPQLAARFHLSGTMLKTCFRQIYGQPIHRYLLEQRMIKAAKLLSETQMTVLQVAEAVGYDSYKNFSRVFKEAVGVTPADYRRGKQMRRGNEEE